MLSFERDFCSFDETVDSLALNAEICLVSSNDVEEFEEDKIFNFSDNRYLDLENCELVLSKKDFERLKLRLETEPKNQVVLDYIMAPHSFWEK